MPSPLSDALEDAGATFGPFEPLDGAEVALDFGDVEAEHRAVREAAGVLDLHPLAVGRFVGPQRMEFLHDMLPSPVRDRQGDVLTSEFLTGEGKIQAAFRLAVRPDDALVVLEGPLSPLQDALQMYLQISDVDLEAADLAGLAVQGPDAADVAKAADLPVPAPGRIAEADGVVGLGIDHTGSGGAWYLAAPERLEEAWRGLVDAGASPVGRRAAEALRIEAKVPRWRAELTDEHLPQEVGLKSTLDFEKGCYLGQEAVAKMENLGQPRYHLEVLALDGPVPERGAPVTVDGALAGEVTSAADSPGLGGVVALAVLKRGQAEPGTDVEVGEAEGRVVDGPAYRSG